MPKALEQAEEIRKRNALRGYLELGALYERDKKLADAEKAYLGAAKEKSERHVGEYRLGRVLPEHGRVRQGVRAVRVDDRGESDRRSARCFRSGRPARSRGNGSTAPTDALEAYLQTTPGRNDPSLAAAHWRLGMVHEKRQDRQRAKAEYEIRAATRPHVQAGDRVAQEAHLTTVCGDLPRTTRKRTVGRCRGAASTRGTSR